METNEKINMKTPREFIAKHVDWVDDERPMVDEDDALDAMWEFGIECFKKGCESFADEGEIISEEYINQLRQQFEEETREKDEEWYRKYLGHGLIEKCPPHNNCIQDKRGRLCLDCLKYI